LGQPPTVGDGRDDEDEESEHSEPKRGWKHSRDGQKIYNNNGNNSISRNERLLTLPHEKDSCNYDGGDVHMPFELELGLDLELMQGMDHAAMLKTTHRNKPIIQSTINHFYPTNANRTNDGRPLGDSPRESPLFLAEAPLSAVDNTTTTTTAGAPAAGNGNSSSGSSELRYILSMSTPSSSTPVKIVKKEEKKGEEEKEAENAVGKAPNSHQVIGRVRPKTPSPGKMRLNYNNNEPFEVILLNKARAPVPKIIVKTLLHKNRSSLKRQNYAAGSGASCSADSPNSKLQHGKDSTKDMHAYYISWPENGDHEPPPKSRKLVIPDTQYKGRLIRFYTSYSEFKFIYNHIMKANRNSINSWVKHSKHNLEIYVPAIADSTYNSLIHRIREVSLQTQSDV
jgi:hypothetical protein